jgi:hypothetical protein
MRLRASVLASLAALCIATYATPAASQVCSGSFSAVNTGGSTSNCPGPKSESFIFSIVGSSQCPQSGVYNRTGSAKETVTITATGTCTPVECIYTNPQMTIDHSPSTTVTWNWTNGVVSGQACASSSQTAWRNYPEIGECGGSFCCAGEDQCNGTSGATWVASTCTCQTSPLIVVMAGGMDGAMTSAERGAPFTMIQRAGPAQWAWPQASQRRVGWLARDRDGDGRIGGGSELYGGATPHSVPPGQPRHGFTALAEEDSNGDGLVTSEDANYLDINIWFDGNGDGESQSHELVSLQSLGIIQLSTRYQTISKTDQHGNRFEYQSNAIQQAGRHMRFLTVYDVYPQSVRMPAGVSTRKE